VEVVRGDLTIPESLDRCVEGIDAVFLVWTAPPNAVVPAMKRIANYARRLVLLTSPHKTPHPFFQQPNPMRAQHAQIEQVIEASGIEWTFLRPGMFAGNSLGWWAEQIRSDKIVRWPYLDVHTAPIHERDIAAVAVRALTEDRHAGREYVLTGPQSLSQGEQISIIADVLGRSVRMEDISPDEARRELRMPPGIVNMLLGAWGAAVGHPAFVTSTVAGVTGTPARTFRDWAKEHASEFCA
jgi:uncharacterized protein YbjT (DUF2867 family)